MCRADVGSGKSGELSGNNGVDAGEKGCKESPEEISEEAVEERFVQLRKFAKFGVEKFGVQQWQ